MEVQRVTKEEWSKHSADAHKVVFAEQKPAHFDRIDYTLCAVHNEQLIGYVTARETDHETVYWQYGGTFPPGRGTILGVKAFQAFITWARTRYKRVHMLIENDNWPMLKMAMHCKLKVVGMRNYHGKILLEHGMEFT